MKQYNLKIDFALNVKPNGKVNKSTMIKMAKLLKAKQCGDYFITDSIGYDNAMFTMEKTVDNFDIHSLVVDCEITSDDIDWYNRLAIEKNSGKWDFTNTSYESYNMM